MSTSLSEYYQLAMPRDARREPHTPHGADQVVKSKKAAAGPLFLLRFSGLCPLLHPSPIQGAILYRLGHMDRLDYFRARQVGDGAGKLEYAMGAAGAQV